LTDFCLQLHRSLLAIVALALSAVALAASPAQSTAETIPLDIFAAQMDRLIADLDAADRPLTISALAEAVPDTWHVAPEGQRIDVSGRWLSAALEEAAGQPNTWSSVRPALRQRLLEIRDDARAAAAFAPGQTHAEARAAVGKILERDEFRQSAASRWREQLQQRLGEWLEDLWARLGGGRASGRRLGIALAWAASLAAFGALGFWLVRTMTERAAGVPLGLAEAAARRPRARDLALRALTAARAGNSREAVRLAYAAALVRLEEQGVWRVDDARTPREYLPLLDAADHRRRSMIDLTRRFEQIWYGNRPAEDEEAARATAHLEDLGCLRPGERAI
jgi:Domain of unknown function (DUF4129)